MTCKECKHWQKLELSPGWGRCPLNAVNAMIQVKMERVIQTHRDFGCNQFESKVETEGLPHP
jgi:hypothetical protein